MINNRFLLILLFSYLFEISSFAQFNLVKDFDGGAGNSFGSSDKGVLYSVGTKLIVRYDSLDKEHNIPIVSLAAVDVAGNGQRLSYSTIFTNDEILFSDFKTLPDGKVAFVAIESTSVYKIIVTDGTDAGTSTVYTATTAIHGLELIDNGLFFTNDGTTSQALMKIDPTTLSVSEVLTFGSIYTISDISKISHTALVFMAADAADDKLKLYISDGTATGTTELAVINSGADVAEKALLTQVGNKVYFFYKNPDDNCCSSLWVTDGTVAGTKKIKEFKILSAKHLLEKEMVFGWKDRFYFAAIEKGIDSEHVLWVSDGTTAGTTLMMTLSAENIHTRCFTVFQDALYFITTNGMHYDNKLYKTDGTKESTVFIDVRYKTYPVGPYELETDGEYLYMAGASAGNYFGAELFRFDGTHTQCDFLEDKKGFIEYSPQPNSLFVHDGALYFTASLKGTGDELYTTDSEFVSGITTATQTSVADIFVLYPNPAIDQVTIRSTENIKSVRVMNQLGNVLAESTDNNIQMNNYAEGVYFVEVQLVNGETGVQKIVVMK